MLLVFGSLNVDLLFRVPALPGPGETVLCPTFERAPGGKGANQAAAAAKAGAEVVMAGLVGRDEAGTFVRQALVDSGVDDGPIGCAKAPTGTAVIGVDDRGENQIIVAGGANLELQAEIVDDRRLAASTTLLCQNEVRPEATFALIERAHHLGIRTILNLAPASAVPDEVLVALDVLVVNEHEAVAAAGGGRTQHPGDLARELAARHRLTCVVTLGAEGALAVTPEGGRKVPPLVIEPVDTTGAGDAFVGVLAGDLDQGQDLDQALRRASVAAGLTCLKLGAQSSQPSAAAIDARLGDLAPVTPFA